MATAGLLSQDVGLIGTLDRRPLGLSQTSANRTFQSSIRSFDGQILPQLGEILLGCQLSVA
jgi:hypothetical protein